MNHYILEDRVSAFALGVQEKAYLPKTLTETSESAVRYIYSCSPHICLIEKCWYNKYCSREIGVTQYLIPGLGIRAKGHSYPILHSLDSLG
jgi:hypothetical protein